MELRPASTVATQLSESDLLQEEKNSEIERLHQELQDANEEIHSLFLGAEEATTLHQHRVSGLQEELSQVKADLLQAQHKLSECSLEVTSLRAEIDTKDPGRDNSQSSLDHLEATHPDNQAASDDESVTRLREELQNWRAKYLELKDKYDTLQESNNLAVMQLEKQEVVKYRSRSKVDDFPLSDSDLEGSEEFQYYSKKRASLHGGSSISFGVPEIVGYASDYDEDNTMTPLQEEGSDFELQMQLESEEPEKEAVQAQCNPTQEQLPEVESGNPVSRQEWERLLEELWLCREEIERLNGTIPIRRVPVGGLKRVILFAAVAAGILLYHCLKRRCGPSLRTC